MSVPERVLQDLKLQLQRDADHLAKPVEGTNFNYGFNTDYLKDLLSYWENKYDWRAAEKRINDLGQYLEQNSYLLLRLRHPTRHFLS